MQLRLVTDMLIDVYIKCYVLKRYRQDSLGLESTELRPMRDAVNSVLRGAYWVKLGARNPMHDRLGPCADTVHA